MPLRDVWLSLPRFFTKIAIAQIVANIPVPNFVQIGRKMHEIRAKLCLLSELRYGFYCTDFH